MTITSRSPDIEAEITLLKTEEGGRETPAKTCYRSCHNFGINNMLNDAHHEFIGRQSLSPGETTLSNIWFLYPEYQAHHLFIGFEFTIQEGSKIVGKGTVTKIINGALANGT